jgi:hypothetical protein
VAEDDPRDLGVVGGPRQGQLPPGPFLRIKARRGPKKAVLAVAASMLTAAHYMLRDGLEYRDPGPHYLDQRDRTKTIQRHARRLHNLGYEVAPAAA